MTPKELLQEIFMTKIVHDASGKQYPLDSNIDENEGAFIENLILQYKPKRTIEVGCAFGISSLYICSGLEKMGGVNSIQ